MALRLELLNNLMERQKRITQMGLLRELHRILMEPIQRATQTNY